MKKNKPVHRVVCGGSWFFNPEYSRSAFRILGTGRSAYRSGSYPGPYYYSRRLDLFDYLGFRAVRVSGSSLVKKGDKGDGK